MNTEVNNAIFSSIRSAIEFCKDGTYKKYPNWITLIPAGSELLNNEKSCFRFHLSFIESPLIRRSSRVKDISDASSRIDGLHFDKLSLWFTYTPHEGLA